MITDSAKTDIHAIIASYGTRHRMGERQEVMLAVVLSRYPDLTRKTVIDFINNRRAETRKALAK